VCLSESSRAAARARDRPVAANIEAADNRTPPQPPTPRPPLPPPPSPHDPKRYTCQGMGSAPPHAGLAGSFSTTSWKGTRRVQLVRRDGRDVSTLYGGGEPGRRLAGAPGRTAGSCAARPPAHARGRRAGGAQLRRAAGAQGGQGRRGAEEQGGLRGKVCSNGLDPSACGIYKRCDSYL